MKRIMISLALIISCSGICEEVEVIGIQRTYFDEHAYLVFGRFCVIHDPDCQCILDPDFFYFYRRLKNDPNPPND